MLTLIVPGLIWTRQALADLTCDLPLPAFTTLLGRGRMVRQPPRNTADVLAAQLGLPSPLPAAALRRLAQGKGPDGREDEWLCLDPVRLNFADGTLVVDDPRRLDLAAAESEALAEALAPLFAHLGQLETTSPAAWHLRLGAPAPHFEALPDTVGRAASPLPLGPAHAAWRRAINEAQMQLHAHPVNREREAAGRPVVNSVWPWGGGGLPATGTCDHDALWSDDSVAQGLGRLLGLGGGALSAGFAAASSRSPLVIHDALAHPARTGDALAWREQIEGFEAAWLAPALAALKSGRLDALQLIATGDRGGAELRVGRGDLWKFWRKPRSLADLAPS